MNLAVNGPQVKAQSFLIAEVNLIVGSLYLGMLRIIITFVAELGQNWW